MGMGGFTAHPDRSEIGIPPAAPVRGSMGPDENLSDARVTAQQWVRRFPPGKRRRPALALIRLLASLTHQLPNC